MGFLDFPFDAAFPGSQDGRQVRHQPHACPSYCNPEEPCLQLTWPVQCPILLLQFCGHAEVQRYLKAFAAEFDLLRHVRLGTEVRRVARSKDSTHAGANGSSSSSHAGAMPEWPRWEVTTATAPQAQLQQKQPQEATAATSTDIYDAVVVANGHYSRTRLPDIPGQQAFPGELMHSHNYRSPERFK